MGMTSPDEQRLLELADRLTFMADQGDYGRKPDKNDTRRRAAASLRAIVGKKDGR